MKKVLFVVAGGMLLIALLAIVVAARLHSLVDLTCIYELRLNQHANPSLANCSNYPDYRREVELDRPSSFTEKFVERDFKASFNGAASTVEGKHQATLDALAATSSSSTNLLGSYGVVLADDHATCFEHEYAAACCVGICLEAGYVASAADYLLLAYQSSRRPVNIASPNKRPVFHYAFDSIWGETDRFLDHASPSAQLETIRGVVLRSVSVNQFNLRKTPASAIVANRWIGLYLVARCDRILGGNYVSELATLTAEIDDLLLTTIRVKSIDEITKTYLTTSSDYRNWLREVRRYVHNGCSGPGVLFSFKPAFQTPWTTAKQNLFMGRYHSRLWMAIKFLVDGELM